MFNPVTHFRLALFAAGFFASFAGVFAAPQIRAALQPPVEVVLRLVIVHPDIEI
jgi:hypothetical protein